MFKTLRAATAIAGVAATALGAVLLLAGSASAKPPGPNDNHIITFCHRTDADTNPYRVITTDVATFFKAGHDGHNGPVWNPTLKPNHLDWGDIVPAFDYLGNRGQTVSYPGKNLTSTGGEDGTTTGADILANDCMMPSTPTSTLTSESSSSSQTTVSTSTVASTTGSGSVSTGASSSSSTAPASTTISVLPTSKHGSSSSSPASSSSSPASSSSSSASSSSSSASSSETIQVMPTSSAIAPPTSTAPAPSATAHTGQSFGPAGALILGGRVLLLLSSWWLRRGHGAR
jgi:hypothetical protein